MATLNQAAPTISVVEIVRFGEKLILPTGMSYATAIALITARAQYDETKMAISDTFEVFPWDGAWALNNVLEEKYGFAQAINTPGMLGTQNPPQLISIEVGVNQKKMIPWGRFQLPGIDGFLQTGVAAKEDRAIFAINGEIKRLHKAQVEELFELVRAEIKTRSLYRGKAVKIRFKDDYGKNLSLPSLRFIDTAGVNPSMAIYPNHVQEAIKTNLFTPITRAHDCLKNGITLKRGVMFVGTYGTGKTLASLVASKLAVDNGITFIHVPRADELADAIKFARQYQSPACVVFCEDIDRETAGDRTVEMDDILNIIDGIDSKTQNIIVVLTSNNVDAINPAMLRPGRLDAVIEITPPDAVAVEKLIRLYAGPALEPQTNLKAAGELLAGNIPATIAEVVKRAKLAQLALQEPNTEVKALSGEAIVAAAGTMRDQVALMQRLMAPAPKKPTLDQAVHDVVQGAFNGARERIEEIHDKAREIRDLVS